MGSGVDGRAMDAPSELVTGGEHACIHVEQPRRSTMNRVDMAGSMQQQGEYNGENNREFSTVIKADGTASKLFSVIFRSFYNVQDIDQHANVFCYPEISSSPFWRGVLWVQNSTGGD